MTNGANHCGNRPARHLPVSSANATHEALEPRRLMAATPWTIDGTSGADAIQLTQGGGLLVVTRNGAKLTRDAATVSSVTVNGGNGNDVIRADEGVRVPLVLQGGPGNDTLRGGSGDDRLYGGGGGADTLAGGEGDDVLVSIGGDADRDTLTGGRGRDNLWYDAGAVDRVTDPNSADVGHAVGSFFAYNIEKADGSVSTVPVPPQLNGQALADPVASGAADGWKDFSGRPLFAPAGPTEHDVDQNGASDCYFLGAAASLARVRPQRIADRVVDLGDGSYAVHFERYGRHYFVRVDGDLPVDSAGRPFYAGLGAGGSTWAPVLEKAWAFFRRSEGTYASTEFGRAKETYQALGVATVAFEDDPAAFGSPAGMLNAIDGVLDAGQAMSFWTKMTLPAASKLRASHVLTVVKVVRDARGKAVGLTLRDPRKTDTPGRTDGADDGYITINAAEAVAALKGLTWCRP